MESAASAPSRLPRRRPAAQERALLVELLGRVGPEADTLCEGWNTRRLAAHLVTRESDPTALAGILVPAWHGRTERLERRTERDVPFEELRRRLAAGPPLGPVGLPGLADPANVHEFFVHHEDVRRAQPDWTRRELPQVLVDALRRRILVAAPVLFARLRGVTLHLDTPGRRLRTVGHGREQATVTGDVGELVLYAFGRGGAADVRVTGSTIAQERLTQTRLGL
jgi:uncharacterized protein (TIGR03085 family)